MFFNFENIYIMHVGDAMKVEKKSQIHIQKNHNHIFNGEEGNDS